MKPSIIIHLDKRYKKKDLLYPVKIRVTWNRISRHYSTGENLSENDFSVMMSLTIRSKEVNKATKRRLQDVLCRCESKKLKAIEVAERLSPFDFKAFKKRFNNCNSNDSLYLLYELKISELEQNGQLGTASNYSTSMNSIKKFSPVLKARDVNPLFLNNYEKYLLDQGKSRSTVGIYLRPLKCIINIALQEGSLSIENYPFGKGKYVIPSARNIKKALSVEELSKIINYKADLHSWFQTARDFFVFSYLANGMNMKDILHLRWRDIKDKKLVFIRAKTVRTNRSSNIPISCTLNSELLEIIERHKNPIENLDTYIFPVLNEGMSDYEKRRTVQQFTKMVNKYLKRIAEQLGIERNITTYFARHSFATVLKRNGFSPLVIKDKLGHASFSTTERYLDSLDDEVHESISETLLLVSNSSKRTSSI